MKSILKKLWKNKIWIIIICISVFGGILGEFIYNFPINKQDDYEYIDVNDIKSENCTLIEGSKFYSENGISTLSFSFEKQFVDKLTFEFSGGFGQILSCEAIVQVYEDGETPREFVISDINNYTLKNSTINIRKVADSVVLRVHSENAQITIGNIAIDNTGNYSEYRIVFVSLCTFFLLSLIYIWVKKITIPLEAIFLCISLTVGTLGIGALPTHKVGFDEEIHFGKSYFFADIIKGEDTLQYPYGIEELNTTSLSNWPYYLPESEEEYKEEDVYRDKANDYQKEDAVVEWREGENEYKLGLHTFSYVFQWLMIKIGMLLQLPFSSVYALGRMGNLLMYSIVVFFAIRHLTVGKRIFFILSLMPTNMMTAMTYSYDAWVNAFAFLGASYLLEEWFGDSPKISYKNCGIIVAAFVLSSLPKAVYIPLLALGIFLPKEKFHSKKEMYVIKGIFCGAVLMMLSTFVLPTLINPVQMGGDSRGGDTSVARQLQYILANPLYYTKLLVSSIANTFFSYTIGTEGLARMGHLETVANVTWIAIAVCYTVFTDGISEAVNRIKAWHKTIILFICFCVMCLVWTALYLSFTPVGANSIAGVQGRYYLPITIWLLWALRNDKMNNRLEKSRDYAILTALSLVILLPIMYKAIISLTF